MKILKKVYKSIKDGTFFIKIKTKLKQYKKIYVIKNKKIKNKQEEFTEYIRLKSRYRYVLEREVKYFESKQSNKIWIFWGQGIELAPQIVKTCINTVKKNITDKEIVILDFNNYKEYIDFPDYIEKKLKEEKITYTHFSDLLRIQLLTELGGIWLDATVLCTGKIPDYILNSELFVYKNIELDKSEKENIVASSWLISSWSNNNIIRATRDLLFEYWKKENYLSNYFLFHLFFTMATEKYEEEWKKVPTFSNVNPHILQFELLDEYNKERFNQIIEISSIHKLNRRFENKEKNKVTYLDYIINNY